MRELDEDDLKLLEMFKSASPEEKEKVIKSLQNHYKESKKEEEEKSNE
jgi:hypothetical protein